MAIDFPNAPTLNQAFLGYKWDGEKWASQSTIASVGTVRYDTVQGLTEAQQIQGRTNIYAAPLDAMAYSGMQVNGDVCVSQEFGTQSIYGGPGGTTVAKYLADGWRVDSVGAQSISWAADPTLTAGPGSLNVPGYINAVSMWLNVYNPSPGANDYLFITHFIEGYRSARLGWGKTNAQPISIGFWVAALIPGSYSGSVRHSNNNRSYTFNFTIIVARAWEWKTITIPGDTAGGPDTGAGVGLAINFTMMTGSTFKTAAGVWTNGNFLGSTTTINGVTGENRMSITGLIVLPGVELPTYAKAPLVMRPYDQELILCKRYYQKILNPPGTAISNGSAGVYDWGFPFPVEMRTSPSASILGAVGFTTDVQAFNVVGVISNKSNSTAWVVDASTDQAVSTGKTAAAVSNPASGVIVNARF
jgi:hypothetical protein